ncbi:flagellar hook-associated protein FlgL [Sphingomonas sp. FW199]|uniref:flagellar hook-associated protein FlgL n=1 Tax=Sphingomonas sp. FW199 TaxID=3400217 RepID=UPI003CE6E69A
MSIATASFYDRSTSLMLRMSSRAETLQTQIATGKKLLTAADDPGGYQRLAMLKRESVAAETTTANLALAQGLLAQSDSLLGSVDDRLQRVSELTVRARSGILSQGDREAVATELDTIRDELLSLANSRDSRGAPIFGGSSTGDAFTQAADGTVSYTGDGAPVPIPIGEGRSVIASENGEHIFMPAGGTDIFATLAAVSASIRSGDAAGTAGHNDDILAALDHVAAARASVGAREMRVELETQRRKTEETDREIAMSSIEDVDVTKAVTELQKTLTILQATQSSFTRLSQLTLFDQLR